MSHDINSEFEWLYPELSQKEELLKVLKKRFISKPDLDNLEKDELVELYHKYIIPLPQRKYRQNRRGRQMTKQQVQLVKKRKLSTVEDSTEPPKKKQSSGGLVTSFDHLKATGDRLKPPPSCVNFEKKTIKISSSSSPNISSSLDKLSLSRNKASVESNSDTPEKKVKLKKNDNGTSEPNLKSNTIRLINKQMERSGEAQKNEKSEVVSKDQSREKLQSTQEVKKHADYPINMDTSEQVPKEKEKKKIKITRISWP